MNFNKLIGGALTFLIIFSLMIFLIGLNETMRETILFPIVEDNLINASNTPTNIYNDYLEFKTTYVFSNSPFITFANFTGLIIIFLFFMYAWNLGSKSPPMRITELFAGYNMLMILLIYFVGIIADYLIDVLVNQFVKVLWLGIYNSVYIYKLFVEWFIFLILIAFFISFISNYIKYYDIINN